MEFPGREGDLDLDAPNEPDAAKGRLSLRLGEARDRVVVGEGERGNARLPREGDEFRWRITSVARRAVTVKIDQGSPPGTSSSACLPKTRIGMGYRGEGRPPSSAAEASRAMDRRLASSRGEVRRWGDARDCV